MNALPDEKPEQSRSQTDLIGLRFGRLFVLRNLDGDRRKVVVRCDCGIEKPQWKSHLRRGNVRSCGCYARERNTTHGEGARRWRTGSYSPEYLAWMNMKARCTRETHPQWEAYGGRGIIVCERWRDSFEAFLADMGRRPAKGLSIDRIDNERGYEPGNCRWATWQQQARNTRTALRLTVLGVTKSMREWAEERGLRWGCVRKRLAMGWDPFEAVLTPSRGVPIRIVVEEDSSISVKQQIND